MSRVAVCRSSASLRLVEQPHILDRDHGLVGEGLQQLDLLVREGAAARLAGDDDRRRSARPPAAAARRAGCAKPREPRQFRMPGSRRIRCTSSGYWTASPLRIDSPRSTAAVGSGNVLEAPRSASGWSA